MVVKVASAGLVVGMMRLLAKGSFKHLPTTFGREAAGTVAAIGGQVTDVSIGDRVWVHPNFNCRNCVYCRSDRDMMCAQQSMLGHAAFGNKVTPLYDNYHDGGLAEYVRVPHWLIDKLPDSVSFDVGAKVHDLANAVRALKCADFPSAATLVFTAATGTMGTATIKPAASYGIADLILVGRDPGRTWDVARLAGDVPTSVVAIDELPTDWSSTGGLTKRLRELAPDGAHAVIDYVPGGPTTEQALAALVTGGTLAHMGFDSTPLTLTPTAMMVPCWRFVGTRACTRNDVREVLALLDSGLLNVTELITHRYPLADALKAIDAM